MPIVGNEELFDPNAQGSKLSSILDSLPSATTTMGWNLGRVSNTITKGGTAARWQRFLHPRGGGSPLHIYNQSRGTGGLLSPFGGGFSQTASPMHWGRLSRPANIDTSFYGEHSKIYTPFQGLSSAGNWMFEKAEKHLKIGGQTPAFMQNLLGGAERVEGQKLFSPGTFGRIRSFDKISRMSSSKFAGRGGSNILSAMYDINPDVFAKTLSGLGDLGSISQDALKFGYRSGIGSTITGRISGRVAGYVQGTEAAFAERAGVTGAEAAAKAGASSKFFTEGVEGGIKAFAEGGKLAKFVGSGAASGVLRGANAASWILLAHDLAEGAGKLVAGGIHTAIEAAQSVKGSIDKPVMGMGFKDNSVAATSRQRGVMAIQNSRLNARSALGSEASMMNARFG